MPGISLRSISGFEKRIEKIPRSIYELHAAAFRDVDAYAVIHNENLVAKIAFKYPRDGAGRLYAYVHFYGEQMVRGFASGYGYDKRSAACQNAIKNFNPINGVYSDGTPHISDNLMAIMQAFKAALSLDNGHYFDHNLSDAGFVVRNII